MTQTQLILLQMPIDWSVSVLHDMQCLKLWYKFVKNELPHFFKSMFTYNHELDQMKTRSHDMLHLYPTHTTGACDILKQSTVKSLIYAAP